MESNQTASRAARRFLTERIRDDWDWPNPPEYWSASDEEVRNVTQFRERFYASTSDLDNDTDGTAAADPYKFDSPDAIGTALESKAESLSRKRRTDLEAEMAWNEGLAQYIERRDVWTGAASLRKYGRNRVGSASEGDSASTANSIMASDTSSANNAASSMPIESLTPVAPRILAGNPIRDKIGPQTYHDIYEKVVMTSRSPTVPINLSDMTSALVQGWKDNGEWPPKAGPLDPLAGRKRGSLAGLKMDHGEGPFLSHHPHMKKGVDSVRRIFHLNGHPETTPPG